MDSVDIFVAGRLDAPLFFRDLADSFDELTAQRWLSLQLRSARPVHRIIQHHKDPYLGALIVSRELQPASSSWGHIVATQTDVDIYEAALALRPH